ncbi:MAG: acyltransferase family protein [Acidimicrobiia bacterium]
MSASEPRARLGTIPALTGLRGVAVLLVVMLHSAPLGPATFRSPPYNFWRGGFLGVDLFFAISGFLITSLLLEERESSGRVSFRNFYARRALRLLPALYVMLAAYATYSIITRLDWYQTRTSIIWAVCYASNFQLLLKPASVAPGLGHLWSLAIEEQFYLIWPVAFVTAMRFTRRTGALVAGILVAICLVGLNRLALEANGTSPLRIFVRLDTRSDTLLLGALAAVVWFYARARSSRWFGFSGWAGAATFLWCLSMRLSGYATFWARGGFTLVGVAATAMVVAVVSGQWSARHLLAWKPLLILGEVSYALYLWHLPIFTAVERYDTGWPAALRLGVAWSLTAMATTASWFLVERPANRFKRRFRRIQVAGLPAT